MTEVTVTSARLVTLMPLAMTTLAYRAAALQVEKNMIFTTSAVQVVIEKYETERGVKVESDSFYLVVERTRQLVDRIYLEAGKWD